MPVLADVGSATFALVLALAVTIGLILWQTQRQWSRTYGRWRYREELEEPSFHSGVTAEELARWEVRMHELARDLQGQLDTKIALVAELVAEAQRASRKLEELLQQAGSFVREVSAPPPFPSQAQDSSSAEAGIPKELSYPASNFPEPSAVYPGAKQEPNSRLTGRSATQWNLSAGSPQPAAWHQPAGGKFVLAENGRTPALPNSSPTFCVHVSSGNPSDDLPPEKIGPRALEDFSAAKREGHLAPADSQDRFAAVLRLHELGLPPGEIARQTGIGVGEVELILRLRRLPQGGQSGAF